MQAISVLASAAFLLIRIPAWSDIVSFGHADLGGDLYQMVRIEDFREPMPPETSIPAIYGSPWDSTGIVLAGDSHIRFARGPGTSLAERLHGTHSDLRAVSVSTLHPRLTDPVDLLRKEKVRPGLVRVVIWESTERILADAALHRIPQPFHPADSSFLYDLSSAARSFRDRWFTGSEVGYQFLLLNSIATRDLVESWNTFRYRIFGEMSGAIGAWTTDPPSLFMAEELTTSSPIPDALPTSFRQTRDSSLSEAIAASLADVRNRLEREYGARLIVLIVPAKSSLMHRALGVPYDDFVPRTNRALERRGIRTINAWMPLESLGDAAVLRTETHLSPITYALLADSLSNAIDESPSKPMRLAH